MIIGCFALLQPFSPLSRQFAAIRELGLAHADLTDNHDGASLGAEFGFSASLSLDSHPASIRELARDHGLSLTSVCAHASLLDPMDPATYGTAQIIKAIRLAHLLGIPQVITTEGEPKTAFGHGLNRAEQILCIREKLQTPLRWAEELGIELLLEPHGPVTDTVDGMGALLDALGHEKTLGINLDTGNAWLGGGEPLEFIKTFGKRIRHVHWKDMGAEWEGQRGRVFGCGMGTIPLGSGVIGLDAVVRALLKTGFAGPTTLEVAGVPQLRASLDWLEKQETL